MTTLIFIIVAVLAVIVSYLIGSIPFGLLIGKMKGIDVRTQGSCNIGATNVTRVVGKGWGKLCFFCDFSKGLLPVLVVKYFLYCAGYHQQSSIYGLIVSLTALAAVLGHIFPIYLKFKGGKGVSTAAGSVLALNWLAVVIAAIVWVVTFFVSRYVSLASIFAAVALPLSAWLLMFFAGISMSLPVGILLILFAVLTIVKHRSNIQRLLNGTENRFEKKKKEETK